MLDQLLNYIACINRPAQDWEKELQLLNRNPSNRMQQISKGGRSGAITKMKVPIYEWMCYEKDGVLFHYKNESFYTHSREAIVCDGT